MTEQRPERPDDADAAGEDPDVAAGSDGGEYRENDLTADAEPAVDPTDVDTIVPSGGIP